MGIGTATCVQFATEYRADAGIEQRFFDWAQGLMSGVNDALEDTVGKISQPKFDADRSTKRNSAGVLRRSPRRHVPERNQCPNELLDNCAFGTPTGPSTR
jgi:hypothetical protein